MYNIIMKSTVGDAAIIEARAKINLCLNITGVSGGMHLIDTVIAPIGLCDTVTVKVSDTIRVAYTDGRRYQNDTALKAAKLICGAYGLKGADILIEKRIPEGAGMGGSSADAAGVARGIREVYGLPDIPASILIRIGSDVPAMYAGRPVRVRGSGEEVTPVEIKRYMGAVVIPDYGISTAEAYATYDRIGGDKADIDGFLKGDSPAANALQRAALTIKPELEVLLKILKEAGFSQAVMTGSGSGFIGFTDCPGLYIKAKEQLESFSLADRGIRAVGFDTERICQRTN